MMRQEDREIARELKEKVSEIASLVDFRVFGSRARGDSDEYSDLDVFLEFESVDKALEEQVSNFAWEIGFRHGMVISPLVFSRHELEKTALRASPIVRAIAEEGVRI